MIETIGTEISQSNSLLLDDDEPMQSASEELNADEATTLNSPAIARQFFPTAQQHKVRKTAKSVVGTENGAMRTKMVGQADVEHNARMHLLPNQTAHANEEHRGRMALLAKQTVASDHIRRAAPILGGCGKRHEKQLLARVA